MHSVTIINHFSKEDVNAILSPSDNSRTETGSGLELAFQPDPAHAHQQQYKTEIIDNLVVL